MELTFYLLIYGIIVLLKEVSGPLIIAYLCIKYFYRPSNATNTTVILSDVFLWNANFITFYVANPQNSWMFLNLPSSLRNVSQIICTTSLFVILSNIPSPKLK